MNPNTNSIQYPKSAARRLLMLAVAAFIFSFPLAAPASAKSDAEALQDAFIKTGRKTSRSVVQIRVVREEESPYRELPAQEMMATRRGGAPGYNERPYGPCTGVLIDAEGHVLTSNFNVEGKIKKITVTFPSGHRHEATLLGRSEILDVALLKIQGDINVLHYLEMKTGTESLIVGTYTIVVSRTENVLQHSQTSGVISAVKRLHPSVQAIQIEAKVNYGNSGAPVVDLNGNFIGLVGFVRPSSKKSANPFGQSSGIGFANTADKILAILEDLKAGKVIKAPEVPFLGFAPDPAYTKNDGVLVRQVVDGSAAKEAGLEPGDIIIEFDGKPVLTFRDLAGSIMSKKVGDAITFKVKRGEETLELKTTLRARPAGQ